MESIFQQFVQVHHITPYYIIMCLSFLPLLSLCLCHFVRCVGMRRGCFHLGLYHYLCIICYYFSFCAFFITLMPDIGQRFLSSFFAFFGIHIYIQPVCWGGGLCIRHMLSSCLKSCLYTLTGWGHNEDIAFHCSCSVPVTGSESQLTIPSCIFSLPFLSFLLLLLLFPRAPISAIG